MIARIEKIYSTLHKREIYLITNRTKVIKFDLKPQKFILIQIPEQIFCENI